MLDEIDHVAAFLAAATIPKLLFGIDREAIVTTAFRARPDELIASALELDAVADDFFFDGDALGERNPRIRRQSFCRPAVGHLRPSDRFGLLKIPRTFGGGTHS